MLRINNRFFYLMTILFYGLDSLWVMGLCQVLVAEAF